MGEDKRLERFRARARRTQLVVGLGFLAFVLGSLSSAFLVHALAGTVQSLPWRGLQAVAATLLSQLWVLLFVPLFSFVLGRALEVSRLGAPAGMAGTGLFFLLGLTYVTQGAEGFTALHPAVWTTRLACLAAGIWVGGLAITRARRRAAAADVLAQERAAKNAAEYAELIEASERLAARRDEEGPK